jgi:hypothetical protein
MRDDLQFFTRIREFARYSDRTLRRMIKSTRRKSIFGLQGTRDLILRAFEFENRQDRRHHLYRALSGAHLISIREYFEAQQDWTGSSSECSESEFEDSDDTLVDSDEDRATDHLK